MAYTKLDSGLTESTIWQAPDATRLVWITMLARADQNGYIGASVPGLAGLARVSLEACVEAIKTLESPDQWSRTREHDGRRIAPADGGWVLLNHSKYREKQSADDRRERSRIAMAALRAKRRQQANELTSVNSSESKLMQAEAEAEARKKNTGAARQPAARALNVSDLVSEGVSEQHAKDWLKARGKVPLTQTAWSAFKREAVMANMTLGAAVRMSAENGWRGFKAEWVEKAKPRGDAFEGAL